MKRQTATLAGAACAAALIAVGLSGCGTSLVTNDFSVTIVDPGAVLPAGPTEVSIFDSSMGASDEWARKTMGTTTPGKPYVTSFQTTAGRMIGDSGAAEQVNAGLAIPGLTPNGYFGISLKPQNGQTVKVSAPFVGYYNATTAASKAVPPLPLEISAQESNLTWNLRIVVNVPANWPKSATMPVN